MKQLAPLAFAALLVGCGGGDSPEVISGVFALTGDVDTIRGDWDSCVGLRGYDDFGPNMDVTVRSGNGEVIGVGATANVGAADLDAENAQLAQAAELAQSDTASTPGKTCIVKFNVEVEATDFYLVEAGNRGDLSYTHRELEDSNWWVALSLGD